MARLIAEHRIGAIMHFAGSIVVPESVEDPLKYYLNNTVKSRALIESAVQGGVKHFIFSSTAATYGMPAEIPVREDAPTEPINPYGWSKLMTERMLKDAAAAHPLNYCALRYFNVAGADPQGRSGQSTAGATHLIKVAVEAAIGKRAGVDVFGTDFETPDGTGVRDYIHVSDLAAAHVHALARLLADPARSLTMNCGYGRGYSVLEVLDAVDRVTNQKIERRLAGRAAPAIRMLWLRTMRGFSPSCPGGRRSTISIRSSPTLWPGSGIWRSAATLPKKPQCSSAIRTSNGWSPRASPPSSRADPKRRARSSNGSPRRAGPMRRSG